MNKTIAQLKKAAKQNLLGHYGSVIGALILTLLFGIVLSIPFSTMTQQGLYYGVFSRVILGYAGTLIVSLVTLIFGAGLSHIHLQIARGQETKWSELFYTFRNRPDRYIGFGLLEILLSVACIAPGYLCMMPFLLTDDVATVSTIGLAALGAALLVAGCIILIIVAYSWSMTTFILLDDDNIRVTDAIRESRRLMRGRKWKFFVLSLSFIGWLLFSILTCFVGLLWILPYMTQAQTCFYLDLLPETSQHEESGDFDQSQTYRYGNYQ
ncbi:MAG: DUF975 family protein [Clostridiales bacterium]|nr:DUF975 family protein [Clostridiales bacterium]